MLKNNINKETKKCSFCGKDEKEVKKIIQGPYACICNDCVKKSEEYIDEELLVTKGNDNGILKPHNIVEKLDEYVIGQYEAKKMLAVAVYNHYKRINIQTSINIQKSNILMVGPTGSGKTYLMTTLAKILDVPIAIVDATSLTEAGYVGEDVESILAKLIKNSNMDINKAEKGIIYIDEIDKICRRNIEGRSNSRDVSGEGVQQALLKIIEGSEVEVPIDSNRGFQSKKLTLNTKNILFVCGGAFDGIEDTIKRRIDKKSIGFSTKRNKEEIIDSENLFGNISHDDIIKYGFIPEFIGRVPTIAILNKLKHSDLKNILTKPKDALIKQYKKLLQWDGVDLDFTDEAIDYIVNTALEKNIGARGLRGIVDKNMTNIMYEVAKQDNVSSCLITKEVLEQNILPKEIQQ